MRDISDAVPKPAANYRFKVRLRICPYCTGLAYPMSWPPDISSLKAAKHWQKVFGDWSLGRCGSCGLGIPYYHLYGQKEPWSKLIQLKG